MSCVHSKKKILLFLFTFVLLLMFTACSSEPAAKVEPTAAVTVEPQPAVTEPPKMALAWPEDEAVAYCPVFSATPVSVTKQEGNQAKAYVLKYEGITIDQYLAYVDVCLADEGVVIDSNTNLRDNAYSLNAHKSDDAYMMIRLVYTRATESLVISITYAHPDVMAGE